MVLKIEELRLTQFLMCCLELSVGIESHKYMFLICFRPISSFIQTWLSFVCFSWKGWFSGSQEQNCKWVNHTLTILIHHFFPGLFKSCFCVAILGGHQERRSRRSRRTVGRSYDAAHSSSSPSLCQRTSRERGCDAAGWCHSLRLFESSSDRQDAWIWWIMMFCCQTWLGNPRSHGGC